MKITKITKNHSDGGIIHLSNLCTEILEVTSSGKRTNHTREEMLTTSASDLIEKNIRITGFDIEKDAFEAIQGMETAVCNLGSINVGRGYVKGGKLNVEKLHKNVAIAVKYLDRVIDRNFYPIHEAQSSNFRWRPVGLGLMGLADFFFQLRLPFESDEAVALSAMIQEEIYYQALKTSCELAKSHGAHRDFALTRAAKGDLQFDLAGVTPKDMVRWDALKAEIKVYGLRNSLLIAIAPTATIAHITGAEECIEPVKSNLLKRETLSGEFIYINRYLVEDLKKLGRWDSDAINILKRDEGSMQKIEGLPADFYDLYKTVWEISQKKIIEHGAARGAFIDQSQSLNTFIDLNRYPEEKRIGVLSSLYMFAWEKGLKTTYYFRSRSASRIQKVTLDTMMAPVPTMASENPEVCESCT
jgi:ribonucleoside-diphosphate reductase alpha chain